MGVIDVVDITVTEQPSPFGKSTALGISDARSSECNKVEEGLSLACKQGTAIFCILFIQCLHADNVT